MARTQSTTARGNEPARPADETHGDGVQQIRHHLGLTIFEHTAIEMAKSLVASQAAVGETFEGIADRAIEQAEVLLGRMERAS
jgi:hypothetical protein